MAFARPKRTHPLPVWHGAKPPGAELGEHEVADDALKGASPRGSILALFGLLATGLFLTGNLPTQLARFAAWGAGASVAVTLLFDFRRGVANLIRADVLALVGLYFLTFFEFLFNQPELDQLTDAASTRGAIIACLWGHAGLIVGRHIRFRGYSMLQELFRKEVPNGWLLLIFGACLFLGHLQMLMAVDWNPFLMVEWFTAPRFSQPWGRGRLGDWKALLYELSMLLFLVPPIAGIVMARRRQFTMPQHWFVVFGAALEFFYAFCSGTRNLFISFVVTFLIGYIFALPRGKKRELITVSVIALVVTLAASNFMLKFRSVGLKDWIKGDRPQSEVTDKFIHVDFNLFVISQLVATFPKIHDYLGLEIPYLAIIRPIPRALWPGKPEGMSVSLEATAGAEEEWTVAASFVGEAYVAGGIPIVILTSMFFGAFTAWWSRLASPKNSTIGILIYATGFFAAAISMRSLFAFTTALLPTLAAIFAARALVKHLHARTVRWLRMRRHAPQRQRPLMVARPRAMPKRSR